MFDCQLDSPRGNQTAICVLLFFGPVFFMQGPAAAATPVSDPAIQQARRLWLAGRYEEAEDEARKRLEESPHAAVILARALDERGQGERARDALRTAAAKWTADAAFLHAEVALLNLRAGNLGSAREAAEAAVRKGQRLPAAEWVWGETHRLQGDYDEARASYQRLTKRLEGDVAELDSESLLWVAKAGIQLARWQRSAASFKSVVNRLLPSIYRQEKDYWPARLFSAELFVEKFNRAQAEAELDTVMGINASAPQAHVLRAALAARSFDHKSAERSLTKARRVAPDSAAANRVEAEIQTQLWRFDRAVELLQDALTENPIDERTNGMLAAALWGRAGLHREMPGEVAALTEAAVARNARCGEFYESLGEAIDSMRKFPFAVAPLEEAIRRDPLRVGPRGRLGLLMMRLGEEERAAKLLAESFDIDPYNVRVKNMLEVLDVLKSYAVLETDHFVIRFNRGADGVLAQEAARHLEDVVYPEITERLGYEPAGKTLFEFFSKERNASAHSWFSARMSGLPFISTVGACAGRMVAVTSPNSVREKFHWGRLLKHEFVHVVNLQQTNFHVPHWFTEAMAVRLEDSPRPVEWDELLARRHAAGSLFHLDNINFGFIRPSNSDDWTLAYCQSELYAEYFVNAFGDDALLKLLDAYAEGQASPDALRTAFGKSQEEIEAGYTAFVAELVDKIHVANSERKSLEDLLRQAQETPEDADVQADLALALWDRNRKPAARRAALAALEQKDDHPLAEYVLARLELSIGDEASARKRLERAYDADQPQEQVLLLLAAMRMKDEAYEQAEAMYQQGAEAFPHPTRWLKQLARVYLKSKNNAALRDVLGRLADQEGDNLLYRRKLIQLAAAGRDHADVIKWTNQSLQIDVMDAEHHALLGQSLLASDKAEQAIRSLETAIQLNPNNGGWRIRLAEAYQASGKTDKAREILRQLNRDMPDLPGVAEALEELDNG